MPIVEAQEVQEAQVYKLSKVDPSVMGQDWPLIKQTLIASAENTGTPLTEGYLTYILDGILKGAVTVWAGHVDDELRGIVVTAITLDQGTGCRYLVVYGIASVSYIPPKLWKAGYTRLAEFAKANGCGSMRAMTQNDKVIRKVQQFGGDCSIRYAIMEV